MSKETERIARGAEVLSIALAVFLIGMLFIAGRRPIEITVKQDDTYQLAVEDRFNAVEAAIKNSLTVDELKISEFYPEGAPDDTYQERVE